MAGSTLHWKNIIPSIHGTRTDINGWGIYKKKELKNEEARLAQKIHTTHKFNADICACFCDFKDANNQEGNGNIYIKYV